LEHQDDIFLLVLEKHKGIIYKVATAYCKNAEERKDLQQEIIIQLWRAFGRYNEQYKHSTWVYTIALNVAISFYRKTKNRATHVDFKEGIINAIEETCATENEYQLTQLQQFIAALKELDKAIMLLYLEEKSYKEIASIIGISPTNVATKIGRIKEKLKQSFSQIQQ